jgi:hypothetical protein
MNNGEIEFLKIFLKRFENQLNTNDIVAVLGRVYQSYDEEAASRARVGFEFLFTRYSSNISDDQCQQLRKILADVHRSEPIRAIIEKLCLKEYQNPRNKAGTVHSLSNLIFPMR